MAFTLEDFDKIWASTSPLTPYEFSDSNYQQGWNFIGATPPARQMWDFLQKRNDEKTQWLYNNKLSLVGGTMTGDIINQDGNVIVPPYAVELYKSNTGATAGDTVTLSQNSSRFPAFLVCVSADLNEGYGSTIGIFCVRFGNALTGGTVRGMNGCDYATGTTINLRIASVDLTISGTTAKINGASMVKMENNAWTKYTRHVYAIYGLNFVIQ
jgi:hypothetical protein